MQITNDPNALFTVPEVDGNQHQYTLYTLHDKMLCEAERLFGHRDAKYKCLSIVHYDKGPDIRFPDKNRLEEFIIRLDFSIHNRLCYQLAHETLHSLAPQRKEDTTKFEEGIAVYFSIHYIKNIMKLDYDPCIEDEPDYNRVYRKVKSLIDAKSFKRLKMIREQEETSFSKLDDDQLERIFRKAKPKEIQDLKEIFINAKAADIQGK